MHNNAVLLLMVLILILLSLISLINSINEKACLNDMKRIKFMTHLIFFQTLLQNKIYSIEIDKSA